MHVVTSKRRALAPLWIAVAVFAATLFPPTASAQDFHLAWNTCYYDGGLTDLTLPCDDRDAYVKLYVSFDLSEPIPDVSSLIIDLPLFVDAPTRPAFWDFETAATPGRCNKGLYMQCGVGAACPDHVQLFPECSTYVGYIVTSTNSALIRGFVEVAAGHSAVTLEPGRYSAAAFGILIAYASENGGPCDGCTTPVRFGEPPDGGPFAAPKVVVESASGRRLLASSLCVTANGGGTLACETTPTRQTTWGAIKALFR